MANPEHVEIVKRGADAIREWREKNPTRRLSLRSTDLSGANLSGADLSKACLHWARLSAASFCTANLSGADLRETDLSQADLSQADLSQANLSQANLSQANLHWADLHWADLSVADLSQADLSKANLSKAKLIFAKLSRVDLNAADVSEADLNEADLSEADLSKANFSRANLNGANLRGAFIGSTVFADLDLTIAKNIETVEHSGPSYLDASSLMRSQGNIPHVFLKGCGFLPWQISEAKLYDPGLTAEQFAELQYKVFQERNRGPLCLGGVFISYSHADAKFVDKVYKRLEDEGVPTWLDRHDMVAGPLQKQVSRAIRLNDVVLLVLSEASIKSDWVENELDMARRKEKEAKRDVLCPVALDDAWKAKAIGLNADDMEADARALWRTLTHKNILDFSSWKTKAFDGQFEKLLRGMKIYYEPKKA